LAQTVRSAGSRGSKCDELNRLVRAVLPADNASLQPTPLVVIGLTASTAAPRLV
jgi:hypothetical protein